MISPLYGETYRAEIGDEISISRPLASAFQKWELYNFEEQNFKMTGKSTDSRRTVFKFQADRAGTETFQVRRLRRTAFSGDFEKVEDITLVAEFPRVESRSSSSQSSSQSEQSAGGDNRQSSEVQFERNIVEEVDELLELEKFESAREIINNQLDEVEDKRARRQWMNKLAQSYYRAEEYAEAVDVWRDMIDRFSEMSPARWLYEIARSHKKNNEEDSAELTLLKIRHRYRNSSRWPEAMKMLAEIASEKENYERAVEILEQLRAIYGDSITGEVLLDLARLYDRFEAIRDYEQAVQYYRRAADKLENTSPESAKQARTRADYLVDNYVKFGVQ
ncbi:MAG: tetratricopeptide repeat protein [bacterium]